MRTLESLVANVIKMTIKEFSYNFNNLTWLLFEQL